MSTSNVKTLLVCVIAFLGLTLSCETEPDPENNTGNQGANNPADNFTGDELAAWLAFNGADKMTGSLPQAPDLLLKMDVKDTIPVMKGLYGERVVVKHDGLHDVEGFYIAVANSSFYYDVPLEDPTASDSVDAFIIGVSDGAAIDFPFTVDVIIQPHDADGNPLDEFERKVTVVDPEPGTGCPITVPFVADGGGKSYGAWQWTYTLAVDNTGAIVHWEAPGVKKGSPYITGGCCNDDGTSSTVADDPYCMEKFNDGTPNPKWRSLEVSHYFTWVFDLLWFYDNGTFIQQNFSQSTSYRPSKSDFCEGEPGYDFDQKFFNKTGTHDFTPGADYLNLQYDPSDPPVFGKIIKSGEILYDCGALAFIYEMEGQTWILKFRRADPEGFAVNDGEILEITYWD